jgi:DNA polymerase III epsilon subunit-like protein
VGVVLRFSAYSSTPFCLHCVSADLQVPRTQIIDTVDLFHIEGQRKISLKYLAWYLLGIDIQLETHCSVEDARTALALYKAYIESQKEDRFHLLLNDLYTVGRSLQWKTTTTTTGSRLTTLPSATTPRPFS